MRNREQEMLKDVVAALSDAIDIVATILEARESVNEDDPTIYDLNTLYLGLHTLMDDVEDIGYDI